MQRYLACFLCLMILAGAVCCPHLVLGGPTTSGVEPSLDTETTSQVVEASPLAEEQSDFVEVESEPALEASDDGVAPPSPPRNVNDQTYEDWLERYRAWDKLDSVYAGQDERPQAILRRIENLLQAAQPAKAMQLIESTPPFEERSLEARRLWHGGQALRALGAPDKAVVWFVRAAGSLPQERVPEVFQAEYELNTIWVDVFRNLFWTYISTYSVNREAQKAFLQQMLEVGQAAWPDVSFWGTAKSVFNQTVTGASSAEDQRGNKVFFVQRRDRSCIVQALARTALGVPDATVPLEQISNESLRTFWSDVCAVLDGKAVASHADLYQEGQYPKALAFVQDTYLKQLLNNRGQWIYSTSDHRLSVFASNLLVLGAFRANELLQSGEAEKLLPDSQPLDGVGPLRLGLAFSVGDASSARAEWDALQVEELPLALRLAGMIWFHLPVSHVSSQSLAEAPVNRLLSLLASAAGNSPDQPHSAPFWVQPGSTQLLQTMLTQWPLDRELVLASWQVLWEANPTTGLARRAAYLYPQHALGMQCSLFLADKAVKAKQLRLAGYYLDMVPEQPEDRRLLARRLEVLADFQVAQEDMAAAYAAYQRLLETGEPISDITRLKIAFLMQQLGDLEGGKENLLRLWEKKDTFDTAMQAEILFYLAEGEAALGNRDQALDHYLKLAWQYPQESMWALTAMYRSASIYEDRQEYEPAARLLRTVIKNAETTKQRDAAKARLESIEGKMGKPVEAGAGALPYPF